MQGIFNVIGLIALLGILTVSLIGIPLVLIYLLFTFPGSRKRAAKAEAKLMSTLMADEEAIVYGLQHRVFALFNRRRLIAITNSRIIIVQRGIFGGFVMDDIQWKDLADAQISENVLPKICGSSLSFFYYLSEARNSGQAVIFVNGVPTEKAAAIYSYSQKEEQAWEEKRRVRQMEEMRAASGGIYMPAPAPAQVVTIETPNNKQTTGSNSMFDDISQAKKLLDAGTISDAEFNEIKAKILSKNY